MREIRVTGVSGDQLLLGVFEDGVLADTRRVGPSEWKGQTDPLPLLKRHLLAWEDENRPGERFEGITYRPTESTRIVQISTTIGDWVNQARLYARWYGAICLRPGGALASAAADAPSLLNDLVAAVEAHMDAAFADKTKVVANPYGVAEIRVRVKGDTLQDLLALYIASAAKVIINVTTGEKVREDGIIPADQASVLSPLIPAPQFEYLVGVIRTLTESQLAEM